MGMTIPLPGTGDLLRRELSEEELFCLEDCRKYRQYYRMRRNFERGRCVFCNVDRDYNKIVAETKYFLAWEVPAELKRKGLRLQLLIVPKRHIRARWELTEAEWRSLRTVERRLAKRYRLAGGATVDRFGDMSLNAGTVPHWHINIYMPNRRAEVRFPLYKNPAQRKANQKRAARFAARYEAGEVPA